jgi:hypothetical protein
VSRVVWLGVAAGALGILIVACLLTPASEGYGTHLALGLPPCGFRVWTGLPCPTCGLTTAFALLARGRIVAALHAHPLGLPLFLADVALLTVALRGAALGRSVLATIDRLRADRWALLLVLSLLTTWLARSLGLDVFSAGQIELLQLADQVAPAHAERLGGARAVAVHLVQRALDDLPLHALERRL